MFDSLTAALASPSSREALAVEADRLREVVGPSPALAAEIAAPARFPAPPRLWAPVPSRNLPPTLVPKLPELPPGDAGEASRAQILELRTLLRRRGAPEAGEPAATGSDLGALEERRRALFLVASALLVDELESCLARFQELSRLVGLPGEEARLLAAREALSGGDLLRGDALLRSSSEALDRSENEWTEIRILLVEEQLLEETFRELGEEPGAAVGPILEANRIARRGDRAAAERLLARGVLAMWLRLAPLLERELRSIRERLDVASLPPGAQDRIGTESAEIGRALAHRNFGAAILAYRRLKVAAEVHPAEPLELPPSH